MVLQCGVVRSVGVLICVSVHGSIFPFLSLSSNPSYNLLVIYHLSLDNLSICLIIHAYLNMVNYLSLMCHFQFHLLLPLYLSLSQTHTHSESLKMDLEMGDHRDFSSINAMN